MTITGNNRIQVFASDIHVLIDNDKDNVDDNSMTPTIHGNTNSSDKKQKI
jgi:hypothetical protein